MTRLSNRRQARVSRARGQPVPLLPRRWLAALLLTLATGGASFATPAQAQTVLPAQLTFVFPATYATVADQATGALTLTQTTASALDTTVPGSTATSATLAAGASLDGVSSVVYDAQGNLYYLSQQFVTDQTSTQTEATTLLNVIPAGASTATTVLVLRTAAYDLLAGTGPVNFTGTGALAYDGSRNVLAYERPGITTTVTTGMTSTVRELARSQIEELHLATGQVAVRYGLPAFAHVGGMAYGSDGTLYATEVDADANLLPVAVSFFYQHPVDSAPTPVATLRTYSTNPGDTLVLTGSVDVAYDASRDKVGLHLPSALQYSAPGSTYTLLGTNDFYEFDRSIGSLTPVASLSAGDAIYGLAYAPAPSGSGQAAWFLDYAGSYAGVLSVSTAPPAVFSLAAFPAGGGTAATVQQLYADTASSYILTPAGLTWFPGGVAGTGPTTAAGLRHSAGIDLNGDGFGDLLWRNVDGTAAAWLMNGTSTLATAAFGPYAGWTLQSGDSDFNGDGKSDLVWTNTAGAVALWLMDGLTPTAQPSFGPYAGWTLVSANGDFNGDGKSDLLWRNTNGSVAIWLMDGSTILSQAVYGPYAGWHVVSGNNDFNGDGKSDLLWQNTDGTVALWLMNGTAQTASTAFGPYAGWTVTSGSADYNGDGKTDLLWQNTNGQVALWLMNGLTQTASAAFGPYAGWSVVPGRSDFNGDGNSDLLWRNTNGAVSTWLMQGLTATARFTDGPYPGWSVASAASDYDGDGKTDLLWNNTDGTASLWLMQGGAAGATQNLGPFTGWSVLGGRSGP